MRGTAESLHDSDTARKAKVRARRYSVRDGGVGGRGRSRNQTFSTVRLKITHGGIGNQIRSDNLNLQQVVQQTGAVPSAAARDRPQGWATRRSGRGRAGSTEAAQRCGAAMARTRQGHTPIPDRIRARVARGLTRGAGRDNLAPRGGLTPSAAFHFEFQPPRFHPRSFHSSLFALHSSLFTNP